VQKSRKNELFLKNYPSFNILKELDPWNGARDDIGRRGFFKMLGQPVQL
jgi:hypothetical protein